MRDANPLADVIGSYGVKLKPVGRHRMSCCSPLRSESNPSFMVYTDQQSWCDFGTRQTGDVFDLVQAREGCGFSDAVKFLGERVGLKWDSDGNGEDHDPEIAAEIERLTERRFVEKISTDAAEYYHGALGDEPRAYLRDHYGLDDKTIDKLRIGWADGTLFDHLRHKLGYTLKDILRTGLFIRTTGGRLIEHHEMRITFGYPRSGKFPYMISRRLDGITPDNQYQAAKYKKTLVKSSNHDYVSRHVRNDVFYGEDSAKRKVDRLIVTEGVTDAITLIMCGWPVISPVTVRFKVSEIERCVKLTENASSAIILNDHERPRLDKRTGKMAQPGLDGAADTAKVLFEAGRDVRIGILPLAEGADKIDVNEYVRDNGKDALDQVIREALPYPEFLVWRVPVDTRPAELDEALSPAYAAIATCSAIQREAYVNSICERLCLTKGTVTDAINEFAHAKGLPSIAPTLPAPPPESPAQPPAAPPSGDGGSDEPPTRPTAIIGIYGAVVESAKGYYYRYERRKDGEYDAVRISNFVIVPKCLVKIAEEESQRHCCDIVTASGHTIQDVVFREKAFRSVRDFREEIQRIYPMAGWSGTDANVVGVLEIIRMANPPTRQGVVAIGYVETTERVNGIKKAVPKWVGPDYVITADGISAESEIIYAARQKPAIASAIDLSGATLSDDEIRPLAQRVLPKVFDLNRPEVILPTLGWFYASVVTPIIRAELGHMPSLWCWGTQGSGKSTYIRDIFWPLLGVKKEPFSCAMTKFAMLLNLCSVASIALVYDEYKLDLPFVNQQLIQRFLRALYIGETDKRGRQDLSTLDFRLVAPVCVIGEMMPSDPALLERIICVSPMKHTISSETRKLIAQLSSEKLQLLGGHYTRFVLGRDIRQDIVTARALMQSKMLPLLAESIPPRLSDNLLVAVLGDYLHQMWCDSIGVTIAERPPIESVFRTMVSNITESDEGGGVKDGCDRFLESLSTYAHLGLITEGIHYAVIDSLLCIHLDSCYDAYLKERRKANQPDETNGVTALRRILREKHETGGYIAKLTHRVRFRDEFGTVRQARAVVIDMSKVPEHLSFDQFPAKCNRSQGPRQKDFEGWN